MELSVFHNLVAYIHTHPHIGGIITFLLAFAESLAIIGAVIPGSVTMTAIGVMIGSGVMPFTSTLIWAVVGAFCGDYLSYWLGTYYNERLILMWPFRKYPHWLQRAKLFFQLHGGKSVVIGRFVGPARSAVPLIAGLMHMGHLRFLMAAIPSATLWSLVYMVPGIIVGMMSLALPPAAATRFILIVLGLVAFSWVFFLLIHLFFKTIFRLIDIACAKLWFLLKTNRVTRALPSFLSRPEYPNPHRQLLLLLIALLFLLFFVLVFIFETQHTGLAKLNQPLYELFRSIRNKPLDTVMLAFTILGDKWVLLPAAALIFLWLTARRNIWAAMHWLAIMLLTIVCVQGLKILYFSPRPGGLLNSQVSSSFPSGHTLLGVMILGFLAFLIAENLPENKRKTPYLLAFFSIILIATSRVYLGAHWFTDVLASLCLGMALLFVVILSFHRRVSRRIAVVSFTLFSLAAIAFCGGSYAVLKFRDLRANYTLYWPVTTLDRETWWQHQTHDIPYFVASRLGRPLKVINVQWLGDLSEIKKSMLQQGWQPQILRMNLKSTLNRLTEKTNPQHLPVLPALYQNHAPALLFSKRDKNKRLLHFMLWPSNVSLQGESQTLWLGSIYYYLPRAHAVSVSAEEQKKRYGFAIDQLQPNSREEWKYIQIPAEEQPAVMSGLNWDGRILLIKNRKKND